MPHNNLTSFGPDASAAAAAAAAAAHHQVFGLLATGTPASGGTLSNSYGPTSASTAANPQNATTTTASSSEYHPPAHLSAGLGAPGDSSGWNVPNLGPKPVEMSANPWGHHTFNGFDNYNHMAGEMFAGMGSHHHHHQSFVPSNVPPANLDASGKNPPGTSPFSPYSNAGVSPSSAAAAAAVAYRNYNLAKVREHHHAASGATGASFGFY